jgi:uncharacterized membrane protein YhiD involved in acid resistance
LQSFKDLLRQGFLIEGMITELSLSGLIVTMLVALFCSLLIYFTYRYFYRGVVYNENFNLLIVMVTMVTTLIIMTIGSNIVLSLGMVGALSIVRFRAAVKDPLDVGFLFWGISAGLTAGAGLYLIAVCGSFMIAIIYIAMLLIKKEGHNYLLVVRYSQKGENYVMSALSKIKYRLKNKAMSKEYVELTVEIGVNRGETQILEALTSCEDVEKAFILEYSGGD